MDDDTIRYCSLRGWSLKLKIPEEVLAERLKRIAPIKSRTPDGKPTPVYGEDVVLRVCADLMRKQ